MYDIASMSANDKTRNHLVANNNIYNSRKKTVELLFMVV